MTVHVLMEVNPSQLTVIHDRDNHPKHPHRYVVDDEVSATQTYSGGWVMRYPGSDGVVRQPSVISGPIPEQNLYATIDDRTACERYHDQDPETRMFEGEVWSPTARVRRIADCTPWDIDRLQAAKQQELNNQAHAVTFSSFIMTAGGGQEFWVNASSIARERRGSATDRFVMRLADDPATAWDRNVPVWIKAKADMELLRHKASQAEWKELTDKMGRFDMDIAVEAEQAETDLAAARAAYDLNPVPGGPEWQAMAAIDMINDYAWPEHSFEAFNGEAV